MNFPYLTKPEATKFVDIARWALARAAVVVEDLPTQRRFAWSVLIGGLIGSSGKGAVDLLVDEPPEIAPCSLDDLMNNLRIALAAAFLDGPPTGMFAGPDADDAWAEVLSRFVINSVRANVVILDRGRYDELVRNQAKR